MKAKRREREQARALRAQGLSLRTIADRLDVALSSASVWVRDVPLPRTTVVSPDPKSEPAPDTVPSRKCSRCLAVLPETAFNRAGDGRQWWCRDCFKSYFRSRGRKHLEQVKSSRCRRQAEATAFIRSYLSDHPCADCGVSELVLLEFDHIGTKRGAVSLMRHVGTSVQRLTDEVARCEVVCANCHRRRTAARGSWIRRDANWRARLGTYRREVARNVRFVYETLEEFPCIDCGEQDICVLEFDHIGPKRASVMQLAMQGYGLNTVAKEVAQCEVRCANCHRRRHYSESRVSAAAA